MKRTFLFFTKILLILCILIIFGIFKTAPSLTFGYGIGDIGILIIDILIFGSYFILSFSYVKNKNNNDLYRAFIFIGLILVIIILLELTLFRGGEYPLSKGFFYQRK